MQSAIERVLKAYGMMVNLTAAQEHEVRAQLIAFLREKTGSDEQLAVQGMKFLRNGLSARPPLQRQAAG